MFYALRGSNWQLGDSAGTGWQQVTAVPAAPVSTQPGTELAAATPAIHHLADSDGDGWRFGCLEPFCFSLVAGYCLECTCQPMGPILESGSFWGLVSEWLKFIDLSYILSERKTWKRKRKFLKNMELWHSRYFLARGVMLLAWQPRSSSGKPDNITRAGSFMSPKLYANSRRKTLLTECETPGIHCKFPRFNNTHLSNVDAV